MFSAESGSSFAAPNTISFVARHSLALDSSLSPTSNSGGDGSFSPLSYRAQANRIQSIRGTNRDDVINGTGGNDAIFGRGGSDRLSGRGGADQLNGDSGNDQLNGNRGRDRLSGSGGRDVLIGSGGNDVLTGGTANDRLSGGSGNDVLTGGAGQDRLSGGGGIDQFVMDVGSSNASQADVVTDFIDGQDQFMVANDLTFDQLILTQGTGDLAGSTLIQNRLTGEYLLVVANISSSTITAADFAASSSPPTDGGGTLNPGAIASINSTTVKFSPGSSEAEIAASGAAKITIGSQTIYIGTQQVSSINQNPIIASFDSSKPSNRWTQTNYEITGADGRGYGLFWSGQSLYAAFTIDGTQGSPSEDFRRASTGATQSWLKNYGSGGGAKVSVVARINPTTGDMTEAAYLSAILSSGKSNTLVVTGFATNSAGNLVISAQSYFAPRRPDGTAMTQTNTDSSPFDYTVEITPDLKTVVATSAEGWT